MLVQSFPEEDHHFASSKYGQDWAGPDGDRLTLALSLMKQLLPITSNWEGSAKILSLLRASVFKKFSKRAQIGL